MTERVSLSLQALESIRQYGQAAYPEECCGFLVGTDHGSARVVGRVEPASNDVRAERGRRFVIRPDEFRAIERRLEGSGESVVGFYHSHPDHPAQPSEFDRAHAWPWFTYVVLAVERGEARAIGGFELDDETREFRTVLLEIPELTRPDRDAAVSESS